MTNSVNAIKEYLFQNVKISQRVRAHSIVWKNAKFTLTENLFRQINSLVLSLVKALFSRNFCQKCMRESSRNFHTVSVEKRKIYSHRKNISSNQHFIDFLSKNVIFTKFLPKKWMWHCVVQCLTFSHPNLWKNGASLRTSFFWTV